MNINNRLDNMSKEQLIDLIQQIKTTCESTEKVAVNKYGNPLKNTFKYILRLIDGEL